MSLKDSIQTIAKTKELQDKVDKALRSTTPAAKAALVTQRSIATQGPVPNTGGNGGTALTGTDALGDLVGPLVDSAPTAADQALLAAAAGSSLEDYLKTHNLDDSNKENDKSNESLLSGAQSGSRSGAAEQAIPDNDATWASIESALIASGATQEQIDAARIRYFAAKTGAGQVEISDLYNGLAGPKPMDGAWVPFSSVPGSLQLVSSSSEKLNTIVGVDPDNNTIAAIIDLFNRPAWPTAAEAAAAGQNIWDAFDQPPERVGFQQGYWWYCQAFTYAGDTPGEAMEYYVESFAKANYSAPDGFGTNLTQFSGTAWQFDFYRYAGDPSPVTSIGIFRSGCPSIYGPTCPLNAPQENFWPRVGAYILTFSNLSFLPNVFDSEVPRALKEGVGAVRIASSLSGDTYNIYPAINGGFMVGNETNPDYVLIYGSDRSLHSIIPESARKFYKPRN